MSSRAELIFADLQKSVTFLADVLSKSRDDYMRAAAIQSFEICFELAWKYLQARLSEAGLEANSPRASFRESGKTGLLDNVEVWLAFIEQRNRTVHTYQPQLADQIYEMIRKDFLPAIQKLLQDASPSTEI
ncbi:MAG: nucleotidyltransferase substrate binding protein [Actinobacteria bacterium]|nr:nucleotidyltransferase substrate binding protein [Actinomycetota bacterium]MCL6104695.1 nucleotidyltransferase substrate binding protein [Actinomycetota bacterium]